MMDSLVRRPLANIVWIVIRERKIRSWKQHNDDPCFIYLRLLFDREKSLPKMCCFAGTHCITVELIADCLNSTFKSDTTMFNINSIRHGNY
jgi:hypothetical protein